MKSNQLIIIGLLVLLTGFVGGWLSHRSIAKHRIHRVAELRRAGGFENHFFRIIAAEQSQRDSLMPLVAPYATRIDSLHRGFEQERRAIIQALHEEVRPLLSDDQRRRLSQFEKRFRRPGKQRGSGKK